MMTGGPVTVRDRPDRDRCAYGDAAVRDPRACGKSHVHNLEPEDLVALTVEAAAMAQVPLSGTSWIPGQGNG